MNSLEVMADLRMIPVIKIDNLDSSFELGTCLRDAGLPLAEITLRTPVALDAIKKMSELDAFHVGAGTVLNREQAAAAIDVGASFIVSPGLDEETVTFCQQRSVPVFPGVTTATEVQRAFNLGLRIVKFFPAETSGGVSAIKALAAPFHEMQFVPTGGVNPSNVSGYASLDSVFAIGGSWMVKPSLYQDGNFAKVSKLSSEAVAITRKSK